MPITLESLNKEIGFLLSTLTLPFLKEVWKNMNVFLNKHSFILLI